jgi:hypothetical protein
MTQIHDKGPAEPSLASLREQVKNVMIPLLIRIFHLKIEAQHSLALPSRLTVRGKEKDSQEILKELQKIDEDLKVMITWCQSTRGQLLKAIKELSESNKSTPPMQTAASPSTSFAQKSFIEAIIHGNDPFQKRQQATGRGEEETSKKPLWLRLFKT